MELQILDGIEVLIDPETQFELPHYMTRILPEEVIKDDPSNTVIAAGADPKDGKITLLTLEGKIFLFNARLFYIPDGPAVPVSGGREIFLENVDGRWPGQSKGFNVEASWMLKNSISGMSGATLHVNYPHDLKDKQTSKDDT